MTVIVAVAVWNVNKPDAMKKKIIHLTTTIVWGIVFLACCRNNVRQQIDADNIFKEEPAAEIIPLEFHENAVFNYSDVFDNISFIKLETNEHCFIGKISKLIALGKYFIVMDINNDNIFVFNESGHFRG